MTTDRDLINQLMYAIKTNNFDDIAEVMAAYVSKGYNRGYDDGQRQKADEIAKRLLTIGMQAEKVANIVGLDIIEVLQVGFQARPQPMLSDFMRKKIHHRNTEGLPEASRLSRDWKTDSSFLTEFNQTGTLFRRPPPAIGQAPLAGGGMSLSTMYRSDLRHV